MLRKIIGTSTVVLGMMVLLYLMVETYHDLQTAMQRSSENLYSLLITMSLWAFLFGVLIGWRALFSIIKEKRIKVNVLLIPALLLALTSFIPRVYWVKWFSADIPFYIELFLIPELQILLTAFSGLLFIQSLDGKQT